MSQLIVTSRYLKSGNQKNKTRAAPLHEWSGVGFYARKRPEL